MPTTQVFYHQSPHHGDRYILSLALNFDVEEEVYQVYCLKKQLIVLHRPGSFTFPFSDRINISLFVF